VLTERALAVLPPERQERLRAADSAVRPGAPSAADPVALSEYAAALYPAWFADQSLTTLLAPPTSTSLTGAAVSARLRRDGYDWRPLIAPSRVPVLIVHGERDLIPAAESDGTRLALGAAARLVTVPDAGHNPFWEQPSIVFPLIEAFLTSADRTATS
jgi:pimeloyl-ACP methyl ester carboxylesterase